MRKSGISSGGLTTSWARQDQILGYLFVAPMILFFLVLIAYPLGYAVFISLTDKTVTGGGNFIGLKNFSDLFRSPIFHQTVRNTLVFTIGALSGKLILGLLSALLLNKPFKGRNFVRGISFVPWITPVLVAGISMRWLFDDMFGVINNILVRLRFIEYPISWLGMGKRAMFVVILGAIWKGVPFFTMSILSGLQTIPVELYEAAEIDGAGKWQCFRYITLPCLSGVIWLVTALSSIWTVNNFPIIWIITKGGPAYTTETIATLTFKTAFERLYLGQAVAVSLLFLPVFLLLLVTAMRAIRRGN